MAYFPLFMDVKGKKCVIVGGGRVAFRKFETLLEFEMNIVVIAPELDSRFETVSGKCSGLEIKKRNFKENDLTGAFMVIAATNSRIINQNISIFCRKQKIYVNVADAKEESDFLFPAVVKRGELSIGINSGGNSPLLASEIRKKVEEILPEYYGEICSRMGELRERIKKEERYSESEKKNMYRMQYENLIQNDYQTKDEK